MYNAMLVTKELSVGYKSKAVIQGVELEVRPGETVTLIGPNGGGKSTILKTITRQLEPIAGAVYLDGKDISAVDDNDIAKTVSILMTDRPRPELMTCRDVVSVGRYPYTGRLGILSADDRAEVDHAMELVGISDIAQRDFRQISDGQKQLVMLARAICQKPKVLVLDEPTSYLDIRHKLELLRILKQLANDSGISVIMSLHELDLAQKVSDVVVCVKDGVIDRTGTPDEIFSGGYTERLFGVTAGCYNEIFGVPELIKVTGEPTVFVIGGGGSGIAVYRELQRKGVAFAAGVLSENDVDLPVAKALAAEVIYDKAYEPVSDRAVSEAAEILKKCERVICCLRDFGTVNGGNRRLIEIAEENGIPVEEHYGV